MTNEKKDLELILENMTSDKKVIDNLIQGYEELGISKPSKLGRLRLNSGQTTYNLEYRVSDTADVAGIMFATHKRLEFERSLRESLEGNSELKNATAYRDVTYLCIDCKLIISLELL